MVDFDRYARYRNYADDRGWNVIETKAEAMQDTGKTTELVRLIDLSLEIGYIDAQSFDGRVLHGFKI